MAASMASGVRDLGWIAWKDERSWMESMSGPRWRGRVATENKAFEAALAATAGKEDMEAAVAAFVAASEEAEVAYEDWTAEAQGVKLRVLPLGSSAVEWCWAPAKGRGGEGKREPTKADYSVAGDVDVAAGGIVVYTRDTGKGSEMYELVMERGRGRRVMWTSKGFGSKGFGPSVAILQGRVYCLEATGVLRYVRLVSYDLLTGADRRVHYEEVDRSRTLTLVRGERRCLFLVSENAGRQRLYWLSGDAGGAAVPLSPEGVCFHPVGFAPRKDGGKEPCYLVRLGSMSAPWTFVGDELKGWRVPPYVRTGGVDAVVLASGHLISRIHGMRTVYTCGTGEGAEKVGVGILGEVELNPWTRWQGRLGRGGELEAVVSIPGATPRNVVFRREGPVLAGPTVSVYAKGPVTGMVSGSQGEPLRWILSLPIQAVRGLIVCAYGAYGLPTNLSTARWKPYLERGWAVGFALVRGGGDHREAWAEAGRREGKLGGVVDLEACVFAMQKVVGVGPAQTCLFGRSAGGYLVGAAVVRSPGGGLAGHVYTEVPYVDVLQTASNPALPLTEYEYLEFGNPLENLTDFETMLRLGPVTGLGPQGAQGVSVICRSAENDSQVFAYESVKWMDALRGGGGNGSARDAAKLLHISGGQGHFTRGAEKDIQRAEDFLLLERNMLRIN